jgi:hypothetical protein
MNLPFSNKSGGNKKTFKILKENEINTLSIKKADGILSYLKKIIEGHKKEKNIINYTKASNTKKYYTDLKKNKKSKK